MDDFIQGDFLVVSTALRAIYQDLSNVQNADKEELKNITEGLTSMAKVLNQFVDQARANPEGSHAVMVTKEPFEDVVALLWQIAWVLKQREVDIHSLRNVRNHLRDLHHKLDEML